MPVIENSERLKVVTGTFVYFRSSFLAISALHYNFAKYAAHPSSRCLFENRFFAGANFSVNNMITATSTYNVPPWNLTPEDFVVGDFKENMNEGKTIRWFEYAAAAFPDAQFYFKTDDHTALNLTSICSYLLSIHDPLAMDYIGRIIPITKVFPPPYPPDRCTNFTGRCWVYMQGGFYGLSRALVIELVPHRAHLFTHGFEDQAVGRLIGLLPNKEHVQVHTFHVYNNLWCHMWRRKHHEVLSGLEPYGRGQSCSHNRVF